MSSGPAPLARTGGAGQPLIGVALLQVAGVEVHSLTRPNFQRERAVLGSKGFHEHGRLKQHWGGKGWHRAMNLLKEKYPQFKIDFSPAS